MKKAKDDWIQCQCNSIDNVMRHGKFNNEDNNGTPLAEDSMILKRWTEYFNDIYNHQINIDISVLNSNANFNTYMKEELPILESEVIEAIKTLKEGKSPGIFS